MPGPARELRHQKRKKKKKKMDLARAININIRIKTRFSQPAQEAASSQPREIGRCRLRIIEFPLLTVLGQSSNRLKSVKSMMKLLKTLNQANRIILVVLKQHQILQVCLK